MDRPFEDLRDSGLLWLINRTVFHPRGYALALTVTDSGEATGWSLVGDGCEPWQYGEVEVENDKFRRAEATLNGQRAGGALAGRVPGSLDISKSPDGRFVIGRADQSIDVSRVLMKELLGSCASNRDGLVVFAGVDSDGQPREVAYRQVGFNPTANPEVNEGGFLLLEREPG
jgi:hypothetical protein